MYLVVSNKKPCEEFHFQDVLGDCIFIRFMVSSKQLEPNNEAEGCGYLEIVALAALERQLHMGPIIDRSALENDFREGRILVRDMNSAPINVIDKVSGLFQPHYKCQSDPILMIVTLYRVTISQWTNNQIRKETKQTHVISY